MTTPFWGLTSWMKFWLQWASTTRVKMVSWISVERLPEPVAERVSGTLRTFSMLPAALTGARTPFLSPGWPRFEANIPGGEVHSSGHLPGLWTTPPPFTCELEPCPTATCVCVCVNMQAGTYDFMPLCLSVLVCVRVGIFRCVYGNSSCKKNCSLELAAGEPLNWLLKCKNMCLPSLPVFICPD